MNKCSQVLENYKYTPKPIGLIKKGSIVQHMPQIPYSDIF